MIQPLSIPNKLAGNPTREPLFGTSITTKDGRKIQVGDPKATRALVSLMDMGAVLGGAASHYGGPAALAELMSALHGLVFDESTRAKKPWYELFHLINDAGHCENGLYALKANYGMAGLEIVSLKKFRSIESKLTGHGESHLFPEGVMLSNGPLGSAFPQSQGLAMADHLAGHMNRVTVTTISDGASMEGEAKEAFAAIPGLAAAGKMAPFVLIITDNNTKLTGRIDADSFSMEPTFRSLEQLGWNVLKCEKGNDLQACADVIAEAFEKARANPRRPVAIHAKTIKGIGTKKTAESASGGHGFPLKSPTELNAFLNEIYAGSYPAPFDEWINELVHWEADIKAKAVKDTGEKIQKGVASALIACRKDGLPVVSVTSDLPGSTGVADFRKAFSEASLDVGVAESNMVSAAAGLSKLGYIPVVDTFAQFGVTKGALPLIMSSLSDCPMIAIFSHTGFQDAADGASHQALSYLSMVASIPNVEAYALSCSDEAEALVKKSVQRMAEDRRAGKHTPSVVFFLGRENFPKTYGDSSYKLGHAQVISDTSGQFTKSATIVAAGSLVPQALEAAKLLEKDGVGAIVVNPAILNKPDIKTIRGCLAKTGGRLVTVEDHQLIAGFGSILVHGLAQDKVPMVVKSLGVNGEFGQSAYNAIELYRKHHIDAQAIVSAVRELA